MAPQQSLRMWELKESYSYDVNILHPNNALQSCFSGDRYASDDNVIYCRKLVISILLTKQEKILLVTKLAGQPMI